MRLKEQVTKAGRIFSDEADESIPVTGRCIFHLPHAVDNKGSSGSQIRPIAMLAAFKNIGLQVDAVIGSVYERREAIRQIENNISHGVTYDFVYSESGTSPTIFQGKKHFLKNLNLDFGFLSYCKKNGIPIALFYRDIYWRFKDYRNSHKGPKHYFAQLAYRYDLYRYKHLVDILYIPSKSFGLYIKNKALIKRFETLPPGTFYNDTFINNKIKMFKEELAKTDKCISLIYVGGLGHYYDFEKLLECINHLDFVRLTICCKKNQWEKIGRKYSKYLTERVSIVHAFGEDLAQYYKEAMIGVAFFSNTTYRAMSMPVKIFEYLSHAIPILATKNTEAGDFVAGNDIGWTLAYDVSELENLLTDLHNNNSHILAAHENTIDIMMKNTWEERANKVKNQLGIYRLRMK